MADRLASAQASNGGRRGAGQQDGTHRLGDHEQERQLSVHDRRGLTAATGTCEGNEA